ncbi:MAG: DUF4143 domain-containing protein, partial [Propionibacteriaceae bacterium]|nr:DUF4143 domain-containing protein [Propionibacteriaceae bacterium]
MEYSPRVVDAELDRLLAGLPAVAVDGAKGVGKTATAARRITDEIRLDRKRIRQNVEADPEMILTRKRPLLIDEWHLAPELWDVVRRAVDDDRSPNQFLLTGSALPPKDARIHSGSGRIIRMIMRPMILPERGITEPSVSFADLLSGGKPSLSGTTDFNLVDYTREIIASGFPGIRRDPQDLRPLTMASYIDEMLDRDIPEIGVSVRRPQALKAWLSAYAAATATTTSYQEILNSATPGDAGKPARSTAEAYRELLQRMWILDPLPAWIPAFNPLKRLAQSPKHHLADPAIAASLLGATEESLLLPLDEVVNAKREGTLLAALFESLAVLTIRVLAQPLQAKTSHLRTRNGDREIDIIVERPDHKVLAIEVKLSATPGLSDAKHLNWLETELNN